MLSRYRGLLLVLFASFCCLSNSYAQDTRGGAVTGNFSNLKFEDFVREVEAKSGYKFYFDPAAMDSVRVTVQATGKPLETVLAEVFRNTQYQFVVDADKKVFITKGKQLQLNLPENFFEIEPAIAATPSGMATGDDLAGSTARKTASSEIKLYEIGDRRNNASGKATISGYLRDAATGAAVFGASIFIESPLIGTTTDQSGYYTLTLPLGHHQLKIRGIGMQSTKRQLMLHGDGRLDIDMQEDARVLKEVVVEAGKDKNVSSLQMGVEKLDIKYIKQVPTAFGETDILRVLLTLPGVKSVGEGSTGMNVRGGSADQNLILFNNAPIYNPSHLFGFFSAFNPDVIQSAELFRSAIPAKYGGRLSSVLEITSREGDKQKFAGSGGIGLLTSRLTLEGPLVKDKTSLIVGGRSTYSNWLLKRIPEPTFNKSTASFYDVNGLLSHKINDKNSLTVSGYLSKDKFKLGNDSLYTFSNHNASINWNRTFNEKLFGKFTGAYSHYGYGVASDNNPVNAFDLTFGINQTNLQADFNYFPTSKQVINFGVSNIHYNISPGTFQPNSSESLVTPDKLQQEKALETAVYASQQYEITPKLSVEAGLRYSLFNALGPREELAYAENMPRSENTVQDTAYHKAGKPFASYHGPEYRLSARLGLGDNSSIKLSFNRLRQYIHMLSNTVAMSPTDIWKLSDSNIRPQVGNQVALGYYQNFRANTIELSVEGYYRNMRDFLDYKSGASLFMNHHIETDVASAQGKAYGTEIMLKKLSGKLNGWISYTYSRSLVRVNNPERGEVINGGEYYPSNFDKPHDLTLISNYRFSKRYSSSFNFTYSTGRPITLPIAKYTLGHAQRLLYSDRNAYRVPDYYRFDIAMNIEGNHKAKKLAHSSWTIAVYNVTGRRNPFSVYFKSEEGKVKGYQLSIFGSPIPTVTYNFRF